MENMHIVAGMQRYRGILQQMHHLTHGAQAVSKISFPCSLSDGNNITSKIVTGEKEII